MRDVEARIAQIAWLVLAGTACRPAENASSDPATVDLARPDASAGGSAIAVSEPDASAVIAPAQPADPKAICAQYKSKAAGDPSGPTTQNPQQLQRVYYQQPEEIQARRLDADKVECRIVWERKQSTETVMVSPVCCPQATPPGQTPRPCPGPSPQQFPGERAKVEVAIVTNDGSRISGSLAWNQWVQEPPRHMCGRRPEGFAARAVGEDVGGCLAEMAELEAAAIAAFDRLARELEAHGAPRALVARARAAKRDEARHARAMRVLARRFGAAPRARRAKRLPVRAPLAIAVENAVEGCVFETFGAVVATMQAARADEMMRAAFERVAADERAHAALAWDVDAWLATLCTARERAAVERARRAAHAELRRASELRGASISDHARRTLGLPSREERAAIAAALSV